MKDWKKVKLGSLLTESKIVSENPDTDKRLRVRLNMLGVEKRPKTNDKEGATKYYIRKAGQFIYGKQNLHKGAFGIIPEELDGYESSSDIPAFDVDESCFPEWIYYFFKKGNFYLDLEKLAKGVGSKRIQPTQIFDLDIYLPSKDEQKKILEKILEIESKYTNTLLEIDYQDSLLAELRLSILDNAIKGRLTKDWRKKNPNVEPVNKLIERVNAEKEQLIKEKKIKREKLPLPIAENEIDFEIPTDWKLVRFQTLIEGLRYGTSKKCDYGLGKTMVLRIPNIKNGEIDFSDLKSTDLSKREIDELNLQKNDILIIRSNGSESIVGRTAVFREISSDFSFAGYLMRARPLNAFLTSDYLQIVFESKYIRDQIETPIKDVSGVKNINSNRINHLQIPYTNYSEQLEIVEKVNELNSLCDRFKQEVKNSRVNVEKLLQSTLQKLLGEEMPSVLVNKIEENVALATSRIMKYNNKTTLMELIDLLKKHGKLHAEDLWKMSKHFDNKNIGDSIDKFYSDLKKKIEVDKSIKEVENEKGYLELV